MIAKRIERTTNDSYRRLAEYIAGAKDPGEKLDKLWIVNTGAGESIDDLDFAIREIEATQALNVRSKTDKSYHLVVSFRDERPTDEALKDIEREFAKALGFEDHQRIAATHQNTDNFHLHVAFNKIHPVTHRSHMPLRDFRTLEKVCRAMEKKHGLQIDLGREDKQESNRKPQPAQDMEAHTWEQSFFSYVREHKDELMMARDEAKTWQDLHEAFGAFDLVLRKRGNGLIIGSGDGNHRIKASDLDRSFSKAALEKKFGPYQSPQKPRERCKPAKRYERRPITRHRGQERLWRRYMAVRRGKDSLLPSAFRSWREFLMLGVIDDPLAMAIIMAQKKLIEAISLQGTSLAAKAKQRKTRNQSEKNQDRGIDH
ncbi:MAG: relaxase/mobilization nuclease domain-containing protein [Alphaproteobacteria bacterium]|nr:relaxase/mobilization nuclease domain-containing protein [Alphaproteobacteria bacterium]